jgi:hypothetical protein
MAYRSDLEAALARIDAMGPGPRRPCPSCVARSKRHRRIGAFVLGALLYLGAFVILAFASIMGLVALCAVLLGTVMLFGRGHAYAAPFGVGVAFALLCAGGFAAFFWLERLLSFDVGRFG